MRWGKIPLDVTSISLNHVFLGLVFILFVLSVKKLKKIAFNAVWIAVSAVLFPIAMNRIFGIPLAVDANSIIFYMTFGLGAYFLYLFAKSVHAVLSAGEKLASPVVRSMKGRRAKKRDGKIDRIIKEKEKEEQLKRIERKAANKQRIEDEYVLLKEEEQRKKSGRNIIRSGK